MFRQISLLLVLVFLLIGSSFAADKWVMQKFESQALGAASWNSGWGSSRVGDPVWATDPSGLSVGALKMSCDASLGASGDHKAAFANENISVIAGGDTADALTFDVYVPVGFPDGVSIQVFAQDRVVWSWNSDTYGTSDLVPGDWKTLSVELANRIAGGLDISQGIKCGMEFLFADGTTWTGDVYIDNVTLTGVRNPAEEMLADFEVAALGANGWDSGWGGARVATPARIADPTGQEGSTGVLEMQIDAAMGAAGDHKAAFANENINIIIEGDTAHTLSMDVYLPADIPQDAGCQIFAQDRVNWNWQADWHNISDLTAGAWNTLKFDIKTRIETVSGYDVSTGLKAGVEFVMTVDDSLAGWTGSVYVDNIKLIGVHKSVVVTLESPTITAAASDTVLNATTGQVIHQHIVEWTDLAADMGETYNVYMSKTGPITDVSANGVIKISEQVPRGTQIWHERPETVDGAQVTCYYAVTITALDQGELKEFPVRDGFSNAGPITTPSNYMREVPLLTDFSDFEIDGDLKEFRALAETYTRSALYAEEASGNDAAAWTPASTDLNIEGYCVMDNDNLYFGIQVIDDDPTGNNQPWEGDGIDIFSVMTDASNLTSRFFGTTAPTNGEGGFRISYAINAADYASQLQKNGGGGWSDATGVDHDVDILEDQYTIEMKIPFTSIATEFGGNVFVPYSGEQLLFKVDVNDCDPVADYPDTGRSLQCHWGSIPGNFLSWQRAEAWTPVMITSTPLPSAINDNKTIIPLTTELRQNYPNPFNPTTTINYQLGKKGNVKLVIYDVLGQEVKMLVNENKVQGKYSVTWNGRDNYGKAVGTGVYFIRMLTKDYDKTGKMLLLK
jgi:hypothetical protein